MERGIRACLALTALALLVPTADAGAYVYWADSAKGTIGRAANDGSAVEPNFITGAKNPSAVAVDAGHVYWANGGGTSIGRANIDGTNVTQGFISTGNSPNGVAVSSSYVFWSTGFPGVVGRADIGGGNVKPSLITGYSPCGVATDAGHVYFTSNTGGVTDYIARAAFSGMSVEDKYSAVSGATLLCGVAVTSSNIYWANFAAEGTIGRSNVSNGGGVDPSFIGEAKRPCGVATFGSQIYWANFGTGTIGRANTDSSGITQSLFAPATTEQICGVAVDGLAPPPKQPDQPSNPVVGPAGDSKSPETTISSGPGKKVAGGRARFAFKSSEAGSRFECKLDGRKFAACRSPKGYSGLKPGRHTFSVRAIDAAGNSDATPAKRRFRVPAP